MTNADRETLPALHVSAIFGGGEALRDVETAIFDLARIVERERSAVPSIDPRSEVTVDVVFILPGTIWRPDHEGIRTGRWQPRKRLLVVQVAVPVSPGNSLQIREFLAGALRDAVRLAGAFLEKREPTLTVARAAGIAERAAGALTE